MGVRTADLNSDGLADLIQSYNGNGQPWSQHVYINNGNGTGWTEDTNYASTSYPGFVRRTASGNLDEGVRIVDVNGDGFPDMIWAGGESGTEKHVYINKKDGAGWSEDTNCATTSYPFFTNGAGTDFGVRIADVNGDGLPDIIESYDGNGNPSHKHVYLNKGDGTGWSESSTYASSTYPGFVHESGQNIFDSGVRIADVNGDGFSDMIWSGGENGNQKHVYINNADGTGWSEGTTYATTSYPLFADATGVDLGVRIADVNGDGLADLIESYDGNGGAWRQNVYINKGDGTGWAKDTQYDPPSYPEFTFQTASIVRDSGTRIDSVDGDVLPDMMWAGGENGNQKHVYIKNGKNADLLSNVVSNTGAQTTILYKGSAEFREASGKLSNPRLGLDLNMVESIGVNDGFGTAGTTTYTYGGGYYYFNSPYDRQFALFATTTKTDPLGFVTKTFYHQGDATNTAIGEYNDYIAKKGKPYRVEVYDGSGNLHKKTINQWDLAPLSINRNFIELIRTTDETYDGDSDHKDKAETYVYATS